VLKRTRWLLLKNPDNLKEQTNERQRLESALELNKPLATAYCMKEDLRQLWNQKINQGRKFSSMTGSKEPKALKFKGS
jgi:hypothetical protein